MELVLEISKYLTLSQNFRATRVCQNWSRLLTSPTVIDFHLKPWFPNIEHSPRIPEGVPATAAASIKGEYIDAYTYGTPVSRVVVKRKLSPGSRMTCSAYADGMIVRVLRNTFGIANKCWIYYLERSFEESWAVHSDIHSPDAVTHLAVSTSIVAMILDSGDCFVWELSSSNDFSKGKRKSPSILGSRQVQTFSVSGSSLAILYESLSIKADITIWSLGGEAIHIAADAPEGLPEVPASDESIGTRQKIFVDHSSQAVVLFRLVEGTRVFICYTRYNLAGTVVTEANLEIPKGPDHAHVIWDLASPPCNGFITVCFKQAGKIPSILPKVTRVVYDLNEDRISFKETVLSYNDNSTFRDNGRHQFVFNHTLFINSQSWPEMVVTSLIDRKEKKFLPMKVGNLPRRGLQSQILCGDASYLVSMNEAGFYAWCFDKNIVMAKQDHQYKEEMVQLRKDRVEKAKRHRRSRRSE